MSSIYGFRNPREGAESGQTMMMSVVKDPDGCGGLGGVPLRRYHPPDWSLPLAMEAVAGRESALRFFWRWIRQSRVASLHDAGAARPNMWQSVSDKTRAACKIVKFTEKLQRT